MKKRTALLGVAALVLLAAGSMILWTFCPEYTSAPRPVSGDKAVRSRTGGAASGVHDRIPAERKEVEKAVNPGDGNSAERMKLVRALPDDLSAADLRAVAEYLKHGPDNEAEYVIKNDLMNKLRNQRKPVPELNRLLIDLCTDREQDVTVRAYALQHLRPQYEETGDPAIRDVFFAMLDETENGMAGGALLALRYLAEEYPKEFDAKEVGRRAAEIAASEGTANLTRISALQVASRFGARELEPVALRLAENGAESLPLRLSAIAALGELNAVGSVPTLQTLAGTPGPVGKAASAAMKKIR